MNIAIFSEVPLWISHHAEAIELALQNNINNNKVHFVSCNSNLLGCPANPKKNPLLCLVCKSQTKHTNAKILKGKNFIKSYISLDKAIKKDFKILTIKELQNYSYKNVPIGNMVYSTIVTELNDSFFNVDLQQTRINQLLLNAIRIYEYTYDYIQENDIDSIYIWNGRRSCDGPSVYAARDLKIKYHTFISGGGFNKILVRENVSTVHDVASAIKELDEIKISLLDDSKKDQLIKRANKFFSIANGQEENKGENKDINYLGYYQFSRNYKTDNNFFNKYKNKKIIAVFTGTYSEFAGVPGYDTSNDFCKTFYDGIEYLQKEAVLPNNIILVVRWHPNSRYIQGGEKERLNFLMESSPENVIHIPPDSDFSSYSLIDKCIKVIGFGSSISIESCLRGKPVLFVGRNMFQKLQCFKNALSFEDIQHFITSNSDDIGNSDDAMAWGIYFSSFGNNSFKNLLQKEPKVFLYNSKSIKSPIIRFLSKVKKMLNI